MSAHALITLGEGYGNIVMATPVVRAVREMGYGIDLLVESHQPGAAGLLSGWDALSSIHLKRHTLRRAAERRSYDIVVRTLWNRGVPLDVGPETAPEPLPLAGHHETDVNMTALKPLGWTGPVPAPHVETENPFHPLPERYAVIAPGYGGKRRKDWQRKAWPHWIDFCEALHDATGLNVIALGARSDHRLWMQWPEWPWLYSLCGQTSIRAAAGVVKNAAMLVAIDNGLAHIGGALGTPTIVLFGATSEIKNRPLGKRVRVLQAGLDCRPCQMTARWKRCSNWRCMRRIEVHEVLNAAVEMGEPECPKLAS